ncbi:hypothetical protein [Actinocorallia libanotica]|uniref:DUF1876 domain-containing protein n=1 Tax=Actinocorallia libanotica TaxID=46162 RepID=A0ABN1RVR7_9ACTN
MPRALFEFGDGVYALQSVYGLSEEAWSVELTKETDQGISEVALVVVPDEDLERPCEASLYSDEPIPVAVLRALLHEVAETGRAAGAEAERLRSASSAAD